MDLKPCPFCGSQPVAVNDESTVFRRVCFVYCINPLCGVDVKASGDTLENAAAAWNRRAE